MLPDLSNTSLKKTGADEILERLKDVKVNDYTEQQKLSISGSKHNKLQSHSRNIPLH